MGLYTFACLCLTSSLATLARVQVARVGAY